MQNRVKGKINLYLYNLAYHALINRWSEEKLFRYATSFEIYSQEDLKQRIKLVFNPVYSTTAFSYNLGSNLIRKKYGEFPSAKNFRNLLINPILPSDLV